jgi:pyrroline-5-carboxylate reductase
MSILILGCGNMGGAMLAGWLAAGMDPARFTVVDPFLAEAPAGVRLLREVPHSRFDVVLLGIKPQTLDQAAAALAPAIGEGTVLLSILAGTEIASLAARLPGAGAIVRVMPNLAAAIGKSIQVSW